MSEMVKATEKNIINLVKTKLDEMQKAGDVKIPANYSVENALKFSYLMLTQITDKNGKKALDVCSNESIMTAMLEMAMKGLNPAKKQCYFIVYGGKLQLQMSYFGLTHMAKTFTGVKEVNAQVIYANDNFSYEVIAGKKTNVKHIQDFNNIDNEKIIGAYCIVVDAEGKEHMEVMNIAQIKKAWSKSQGGIKQGTHGDFAEEMAKKTVTNRLLKNYVNTSSDIALYKDLFEEKEIIEEVKEETKIKMAEKEIDLDNLIEEKTIEVVADEIVEPTEEAPF
jgi:recombination protein RecT